MTFKQFGIYGLVDYFSVFFSKYNRDFQKSLSAIIVGMMHGTSCSTGSIATAISSLSGKSFDASDKQIRYFFSNIKFQINDALWRCCLKLVFAFLSEGGYINKGRRIFIQIDFTSKNNDFQILCACRRSGAPFLAGNLGYCGQRSPLLWTAGNSFGHGRFFHRPCV